MRNENSHASALYTFHQVDTMIYNLPTVRQDDSDGIEGLHRVAHCGPLQAHGGPFCQRGLRLSSKIACDAFREYAVELRPREAWIVSAKKWKD